MAKHSGVPLEPGGRIHLLSESVARRIAAGEVIDRPAAVVRELLDNALDAGATEIALYVNGGGIASIRVVDNGAGMSGADLELCSLPHATSKIEHDEDLYAIRSLGFRGEALSSIAACARLTITSRAPGAPTAHRLRVEGGKRLSIEECQGNQGTVVEAADLFYAIPGRRRFMKSPAAETGLCRTVFLDKALPFPECSFRLFVDGEMKLFLPAAAPADRGPEVESPDGRGARLLARVASAYPSVAPRELLHSFAATHPTFSIALVAGGPSLSRRDRRSIQLFVNRRRINEYSLVQAIEYGFSPLFPGGTFPVAFLFLEVDPQLVDFNIHPAKREVRLRTLAEIHHEVVELIRSETKRFSLAFRDREVGYSHEGSGWLSAREVPPAPDRQRRPPDWRELRPLDELRAVTAPARDAPGTRPREDGPAEQPLRYYGQLFGLFLIVAVDDRLFLIDQHAAHERLIFDRLSTARTAAQPLLIPILFEVTSDEQELLLRRRSAFERLGIALEQADEGRFRIVALPEAAAELSAEIIEFVKSARGDDATLLRELYATIACRAAVKEGDSMEAATAIELAVGAFQLEDARCPHGRPIWHELSREQLYRLVGRT